MDNHFVSRVPWGLEPSLKEKAEEIGVDFDRFMEGLKNNKENHILAKEFNVSPEAISQLREHFQRLGIDSIVGQD